MLVNDRRSRGSRAKLQQDAGELCWHASVKKSDPSPPHAHKPQQACTASRKVRVGSSPFCADRCTPLHVWISFCRGRSGRRGAGVSQVGCSQDEQHALGSSAGCSAAAAEACRRSTQGDAVRRQSHGLWRQQQVSVGQHAVLGRPCLSAVHTRAAAAAAVHPGVPAKFLRDSVTLGQQQAIQGRRVYSSAGLRTVSTAGPIGQQRRLGDAWAAATVLLCPGRQHHSQVSCRTQQARPDGLWQQRSAASACRRPAP